MNPHLPVRNASRNLLNLVKEKISDRHIESMQEVLPMIDTMNQVFPGYTFKPCQGAHPNLDYASKSYQELFGYKPGYIAQMGQDDLYEHVPEEDCEDLCKVMSFLQNFYRTQTNTDLYNVRTVMHYRFVRSDGSIILLRDEKAMLKLNNSNHLFYAMYRNITNDMPFNGIKLSLFSGNQKIGEYRPVSNPLSPREEELLRLIRSGLTTKEMASQMSISHHTVRNIRQRMFEKFAVVSSIDLLNKTADIQ